MSEKGYKNVGGGDFPESISFQKEGDSFEGIYKGVSSVTMKKYKNQKKNVYLFEDSEGSEKNVWGSGQLDYLMLKANDCPKEGDTVRITYHGKEKVKGIKNEVHQYSVEIKVD